MIRGGGHWSHFGRKLWHHPQNRKFSVGIDTYRSEHLERESSDSSRPFGVRPSSLREAATRPHVAAPGLRPGAKRRVLYETTVMCIGLRLLSCNALVPKGPLHYSPVNPERQRGVYRYLCT
eukprot:sb/3476038/